MKKLSLILTLVLFVMGFALAQRTVVGSVTDQNGEALIGATVLVKGTTTGTVTDIDGKYSVIVPAGANTIVFSYTGYETKEMELGASNVLNVAMDESSIGLEEIVVVGYGTQQKRAITGTVSSIKGEQIASLPAQSFDQLLQGRATGVNISIPNGVLNNPPVFRVRGINSINLSSFPLVVIDGIPTYTDNLRTANNSASNNPLSNLNPNDIESIDILKDASAAAIYGSRASAGVLLITTKRGSKGKTRVGYNAWAGWTTATRVPDVLNAEEYFEVKSEAARNANITAQQFFLDTINGKLVDTRWADYIYQTGFSQNHALSFSGGTDQTNYYLALGFSDQEGMIVENTFQRLSGRLNLDHQLTSRIKIGGSLGYSTNENNAPNTGSLAGQAFSTAGIGRLAFVTSPLVDPYLYDAQGNRLPGVAGYNIASNNQLGRGKNLQQTGFYNPVVITDLNQHTSSAGQIQANAFGQLEILKGLNLKTQYGIDNIEVENVTFWNPIHGDGQGQGGFAENISLRYDRWNWQNILTYDFKLADKHIFGLLAGNEQQRSTFDGWGAQRTVVADPFFTTYQGNFTTINPVTFSQGENYLLSYFGRLNYEFDRRYFLNANLRQDEYSAYAPGKKAGVFWGVSAGWNISEETFWTIEAINYLKIRGSYGTVGNSVGIGDFASQSLYNSGLYGAAPTFFYAQAGNPDLTWESSKKTDIGLVFGLFNDRVQGEYTFFKNEIDNLIQNAPQSPSKGIPGNTIAINIGSMENTGHEFALSGAIIRQGKFNWNSALNITLMKNEVTSLFEDSDIFSRTSDLESTNIIRVGESIGSIFAVETNGVNPQNGQRVYVLNDGTEVQYTHVLTTGQTSRWTKVADGGASRAAALVADGKIFGPAIPTWFGGWDNTFTYGGFDLNIQMNFAGGNYIYNGSKAGLRDMRFWNNLTDVLDRWTPENTDGTIPRVVLGDNVSNGSALAISENVEKADFLRIRNITLGYKLPNSLLKKASISNLRVYANVNNAFLFTNYSGTDPEVSANGNSNSTPGVDRNTVPMAQTFTVGLNLGF
jgi:TonB-linked SusC/RagA family outer membrane protein